MRQLKENAAGIVAVSVKYALGLDVSMVFGLGVLLLYVWSRVTFGGDLCQNPLGTESAHHVPFGHSLHRAQIKIKCPTSLSYGVPRFTALDGMWLELSLKSAAEKTP